MLGPEAEGLRRRRRLEPEADSIARGLVIDRPLQFAPGPGATEGAEFPTRIPAWAT